MLLARFPALSISVTLATAGNTLTVDGVVTAAAGSGPLIIGIPASAANNNILGEVIGTGTGTGGAATANAQLLATGTVTLTNTGNSTSFPAGIIIDSGTLLYNGTQATLGSAGTTPISANGGTLALGASHNLTAGAISNTVIDSSGNLGAISAAVNTRIASTSRPVDVETSSENAFDSRTQRFASETTMPR